jgi:hypothetical protein
MWPRPDEQRLTVSQAARQLRHDEHGRVIGPVRPTTCAGARPRERSGRRPRSRRECRRRSSPSRAGPDSSDGEPERAHALASGRPS